MKHTNDSEFRITMKTLIGEGSPFWQDDLDFIKLYNKIQPYSLVSPYRCYFIYQYAKNANSLDGHYAELGVYAGGTAKLIASVKEKNKDLFLFDTFKGLPKHNPEVDDYPEGKFSETNLEQVEKLFEMDKTIKILPGFFPETADSLKKTRFAFVYLDADLYKSTYDALSFFYSKMVPGGVIMFDDYDWVYCKGVKEAIDQFILENNIKEIPIVTTKYQCIIIKS